MDFRPHDEHPSVHARTDQRIAHRQSIQESRALIAYIQAANGWDAEFGLQKTAGAREVMIGAQGGEDDEIEIGGL